MQDNYVCVSGLAMMRNNLMRAIQFIYCIEKRDGLHLILSMPIPKIHKH